MPPKSAIRLIGYIRVSTKRQGESGLGLDAQIEAISNHAKHEGGSVFKTYREVETGRNCQRPELAKAIDHAKRLKARLVIAKLDRLARDVHFVSGLMKSKVDFVACDNAHATPLTIHILSAVAEDESVRISQRTKSALQQAKKRGVLLGSARPGHWKGREEFRIKSAAHASIVAAKKRRALAEENYKKVESIIASMRGGGSTMQQIAEALTADEYETLRGNRWSKLQVSRVCKRLGIGAKRLTVCVNQ